MIFSAIHDILTLLFILQVWSEDRGWVTAVEEAAANRDTYSKVETLLGAGVVTTKVRVIPLSHHPRMVCLRIEVLGCQPEGEKHLLS